MSENATTVALQARFILTPLGSSGDVHPFIGIGRALLARGHEVVLVTGEPFGRVAERAGLRIAITHSAADFDRLSRDPALWHARKGLGVVLRAAAASLHRDYETIQAVYEPGRTVLVGHTLGFAARLFEERHAVPAATIELAPAAIRTDYRQPAVIPGYDLAGAPRPLKRALWWMIDRLAIDPKIAPPLNRFRHELGLPPVSRVFESWVHSPRRIIGLFPDWFAPWQPDWPSQLRLTGFALYDEYDQHAPSEALDAFLTSGDPPIVFTPGSANRAAAAFFRTAVDAANRLRRRALLLSRYAEQVPSPLPASVRWEPYVPFSTLLPRCAAIVHHGGIGTCAQGLAAGIPQLVMPLGFDQPDNATRLWRLGVGRWVLPHRFTGSEVAAALAPLLDDRQVVASCRRWAAAVGRTRALDATCEALEDLTMPSSASVRALR